MKTCQKEGCNNNVWSKGLCRWHTPKKPIKKGSGITSDALSRKSGYKIPPESKKRLKERKLYKEVCDEIDREAGEQKRQECWFCDEMVDDPCDHHHISGRTGLYYTEKGLIKRAHRECHKAYHNLSVEKLGKLSWYERFICKLEDYDLDLYNKEMKKQEKL